MGPRLGSRGKLPLGLPMLHRMIRFNGAATWKSRKVPSFRLSLLPSHRASMGPRLGSRGKRLVALLSVSFRLLLQWGRDLEVAESKDDPAKDRLPTFASMGPRLGSRGKHRNRPINCRETVASMGPRLGSRGKLSQANQIHAWGHSLQWGRDLEVAERESFSKAIASRIMLQWGRDLEVAESGLGIPPQ